MPLDQIIFIAIIQGFTEFIPISSSGHLVLIPALLGWKDQGLFMDVAVHVGTLGSVLIYFHKDVKSLFLGFSHFFKRKQSREKRLFTHLVLATCPVVIFGYVIDRFGGGALRTVQIIAWSSILFGLLLYLSDRMGSKKYTLTHMGSLSAIFFGIAQIFSLINGVSRSGICITAGRWMGYKRIEAAHFAFLMAIPAITAAATLKGYQCVQKGDWVFLQQALVGVGVSFISGLLAISFMMHWLRQYGFLPFVLYRIVLGATLLLLF